MWLFVWSRYNVCISYTYLFLFKLTFEVLLVNKQHKEEDFREDPESGFVVVVFVPMCMNGQLQHSQPGSSSGR